jgi:hypothetical protein
MKLLATEPYLKAYRKLPQQKLNQLRNVPGLIYTTALREGRVVYEKAA